MDKLHMALTELCFAINYCSTINVWEYTFAPREYLTQHLENRFARALVGMVMYNSDTSEIAKPSELLASVRAYMNVLQTVENYGNYSETDIEVTKFLSFLKNVFSISYYYIYIEEPGFDPQQRQRIFPLASASRLALGPT
jgi:hypothetical protein